MRSPLRRIVKLRHIAVTDILVDSREGLRVSIAFGTYLSISERILDIYIRLISTGIYILYSHVPNIGSASQALAQSLSTGIPGWSHAAGLLGTV